MAHDKIARMIATCREVLGDEEVEVLGGATAEEIAAAEAALGVSFPASYRRFLAEFGAVVVGGLGVHGIFPGDDEEYPGLIEATRSFRSRGGLHHLLPVVSFEDCDFALDLSDEKHKADPPVIIWMAGVPTTEQFMEPWAWNLARLIQRLLEELELLPEGALDDQEPSE